MNKKTARILCNTTYFIGSMASRLPPIPVFMWYPIYHKMMNISCELSQKHDLNIWTKSDE